MIINNNKTGESKIWLHRRWQKRCLATCSTQGTLEEGPQFKNNPASYETNMQKGRQPEWQENVNFSNTMSRLSHKVKHPSMYAIYHKLGCQNMTRDPGALQLLETILGLAVCAPRTSPQHVDSIGTLFSELK